MLRLTRKPVFRMMIKKQAGISDICTSRELLKICRYKGVMQMAFNEQLPQWENEGTQPPQSKRVEGWLPNEKPPASWFNWLFHRTYKSLQELQEKAGERVDVEQALQTADDAQATANEANQKAEQAQQTADNAQATADEANQKADQNAADLITHLNENATEAHDGI